MSATEYKTWHALGFESSAFTELRALLSAPSPADHVEDARAMVAKPSPAGVDGLEVVAWATFNKDYKDSGQLHYTEREARKRIQFLEFISTCDAEPLCRLSDAQAIIDGLRGEVASLENQTDEMNAALTDAYAEYTKQYKRIGELEAELARITGLWELELGRAQKAEAGLFNAALAELPQ